MALPVELNIPNDTGWSIGGPYHRDGDLWPSLTVRGPTGVVASFYIVEGDAELAERRAVAAVATMRSLTPPEGRDG